MITAQLYVCEGCGAEYRSRREARECEARGRAAAPTVRVGDIVIARGGFGWYDGDRRWIANADKVDPGKQGNPGPIGRHKCPNGDGNCFSECCNFQFYYVVSHISTDRGTHRPRYHLVTKAMTGMSGYHAGYTYDFGHYAPTRVEKPPEYVLRSSRALIGQKAITLL